jgi:hypothetical protein
MASEYLATIPLPRRLQLNIQIPVEEMDFDCERLVKAYSATNVELFINLPSDSDDEEWGDWRTVPYGSDDSSDSSDEVDMYSDVTVAATAIVRM